MNEQKNRVLFLTNIPSPYRVDFFNELGKKCDLTVLFENMNSDERNSGWCKRNFGNFNGIMLKGIKINKNKTICFGIRKYLNKYNIIVVGGYSTPTGMLAIIYLNIKKIPYIINVDGGLIKKDSQLKYKFKKYFISSALAWLSTGERTNEYLIHYGAKKENIYKYSFTSIKEEDVIKKILDKNQKRVIKNEIGIVEEKVVISIGRFIYSKGFDILLKASKKLNENIGIYIIGGEPTDEYLEIKKDFDLKNIHFVEFKCKEELKKYYMIADLFVLPTREDIWGLVINEAMACGLPVITTDKCIAGLELIDEGVNGYIIPTNDINKLEEKINKILNNDLLMENMTKNNLEKIKKYTLENMALEHIKIFKHIMGENTHGKQ